MLHNCIYRKLNPSTQLEIKQGRDRNQMKPQRIQSRRWKSNKSGAPGWNRDYGESGILHPGLCIRGNHPCIYFTTVTIYIYYLYALHNMWTTLNRIYTRCFFLKKVLIMCMCVPWLYMGTQKASFPWSWSYRQL